MRRRSLFFLLVATVPGCLASSPRSEAPSSPQAVATPTLAIPEVPPPEADDGEAIDFVLVDLGGSSLEEIWVSATPGDVIPREGLTTLSYPYLFRGEDRVEYEQGDRLVVNGEVVGLRLGTLTTPLERERVSQYGGSIRSFRLGDRLTTETFTALSELAGPEVAVRWEWSAPTEPDLAQLVVLSGRLRHLELVGRTACRERNLPALSNFHGLVSLGLFCEVSDAGLAHVAGLTELRVLHVGQTPVSDVGLAHVAGLSRLRQLGLPGTGVDDAALAHVSGLSHLRRLDLSRTQVSNAGLTHLAGLNELRELDLRGTDVSDAGLAHLVGLSQLRRLELFRAQVSDAGLAHLAGLSHLRRLDLSRTQVTGAGLAHLAGMTELRELNLMETDVSDAGLVHLSGLSHLRRLVLWDTQVSDAGLVHLSGLNELRDLDLQGTEVSDAGLAHLAGLTELRELNLRGTEVSDAGLTHLGGLIELRQLQLEGTDVSDAAVQRLRAILRQSQIAAPERVDMTSAAAPALCTDLVTYSAEDLLPGAFRRGGVTLPPRSRADVLECTYSGERRAEIILVIRTQPAERGIVSHEICYTNDVPGESVSCRVGPIERSARGVRVRATRTVTTYPCTDGVATCPPDVERTRIEVVCEASDGDYECIEIATE
jgi:Leucine-rich repeat (LRR) protein